MRGHHPQMSNLMIIKKKLGSSYCLNWCQALVDTFRLNKQGVKKP